MLDLVSPEEIHKLAIEKGWYEKDRGIPEMLCLIHSEVSEALEAYRNNVPNTHRNCLEEELADVIIRVFDMTEGLGIDIIRAVNLKHEYNKTREYRHGGKVC